MAAKFTVKLITIIKPKLIELELDGDFLGKETWTFEPLEEKTKAKLHWVGKTNKAIFSLFSPFVDIGKEHSKAIQQGLQACNDMLCKK